MTSSAPDWGALQAAIAADVFALRRFPDAANIQQAFDTFRRAYNHD